MEEYIKGIKYLAAVLALLMLGACSKDPASELATGRWSSQDRQSIVLVDLPKGVFNIYQMSRIGPVPVVIAKNLTIEKDQQEPHQTVIAYDFGGEAQKTILRINWQSNDQFTLSIVNAMTGAEQELNFVSEKATMDM